MRKLLGIFALLLPVMLTGCGSSEPEATTIPIPSELQPSDQEIDPVKLREKPKTDDNDRFYQYTIAFWMYMLMDLKMTADEFAEMLAEVDCEADLNGPDDWDSLKKHGVDLSCVLPDMGKDAKGEGVGPFVPGFGNPEYVDRIYDAVSKAIEQANENGTKFVLCFAGMESSGGLSRDAQFAEVVTGFTTPPAVDGKSLVALAEEADITILFEMLNTKGDPATWRGHPGFLGNSTEDVVTKIVEPIGSDSVGIAFDIYHQVMMGEDPLDLIRRFGKHIRFIHVAGVTDDPTTNRGPLHINGQQVDYATIMAELSKVVPEGTIVDLEYIPTAKDVETAMIHLRKAIGICESKIDQP